MSRKFLIEQILMDERLKHNGSMTIEDIKRELKRGVHVIEYKKQVKQRIARGQYDISEVVKEYEITKDPSIYDSDGTMFAGRSRSNEDERLAYTQKHQLVTAFDINAGTFKTFKEYNIVSFDGNPVEA